MYPLPGTRRHLSKTSIFLTFTVILAVCYFERASVWDAYGHVRVKLKSLPKYWTKYPLDERLYIGARDLAGQDGDRLGQYDPSTELFHMAGARDVVPCDGVEALPLPSSFSRQRGTAGSFPEPSLGSYEALELDPDACWTRSLRLGPYRQPVNGNHSMMDEGWRSLDWRQLQQECVDRNRHRFELGSDLGRENAESAEYERQPKRSASGRISYPHQSKAKPRTAIVLRSWDVFNWTADELHNVRSLISELSLASGGEYEVFILMQTRNGSDHSVSAKLSSYDRKASNKYIPKGSGTKTPLPDELRPLTEYWNEAQCKEAYPKVGEYGVYWESYMPLQLFATRHPEFDFYWNWEMDVRYTGYHLHLLEQLATWAKSQTRNYLWDRNARFYIPAVHGSYDDFAEDERLLSENEPWGPLPIANFNTSSPPDEDWGVGEEADLITLFPIFDPARTVWPYRNHILNHNSSEAAKPRRVSINTFTRLSRRLLLAMHADNIDGRSMFSEMWPATAAVQHGLKAVYVPHPVFLEQRWPTHKLESVFNAGPTGHVGGSLETVTNQEYRRLMA